MEKQKNNKNSLILLTSGLFGIGNLGLATGTLASLLALGIFWLIKDDCAYSVITVIITAAAFMLCGKAERILNRKDPKQVVIDDFAGQLIALLFLPRQAIFVFVGFLVFRGFDIAKIPPADTLEKKEGSLGIVGDDVVAAIYTNLLIHAVRFLSSLFS